jgi:putative ABC transport system permease protein
MFAYQLRLAWKSLLRNPVLSLLIIFGIGLGIAVAMTFVTTYYVMAGDPIPHKSDRLFYVQMDSWNPERSWDDDNPEEPPDELTYLDAMGLIKSDIPTYQTANFKGYMTVHPESEGQRPFRKVIRMCFGDFFPLFDVPFRYGSGWDREADDAPAQVIVLGHEMNQKLFGGEDSVGRTVRIEDLDFRVIGVIEPWRPIPLYYDPHNGSYNEAEQIFMPFRNAINMELYTAGNTSSWGSSGDGYEDFLNSESIWIQYWVQLDTPQQKEEYETFLAAYVTTQKELGRFQRPLNNKLRDVMAWLHFREVVPDRAVTMLINSLLFLLVCSVNLIGILLGKFLARAPEVGVRRALGASRRWVFMQHLIECELIGVAGCLVGVGLTVFGLKLVDRMFDFMFDMRLDLNMLLLALALALVSAMIAGIYPAWRICRIVPGAHLKTQ